MMKTTNFWRSVLSIPALLLAPLAFSQLSCVDLECGVGTVEKDGVCVLPDDARPPDTSFCAPGTHYDDIMRGCVADLEPTVCGENTEAIVNDEGVIVCEGTGTVGCEITCPAPPTGRMSVCGWLIDAQTDDGIADVADPMLCDPENRPDTGPCSLEVLFYDALGFAGNPTGSTPLTADVRVNNCGRVVATNIPAPATGFLAIGVDDADNANNDNYVLGGVVIASMPNLRRDDIDLYAVTQDSDELWTQSAGNPFGAGVTFGDRGAYLPIFTHKGTPIAGVTVTENGAPQPADDYYFDDTDPLERTAIDVGRTNTGPNGSAILVNSQLVNHSGTGSESMLEGCIWPTNLAAALPNVYFVQSRPSELNGEECE